VHKKIAESFFKASEYMLSTQTAFRILAFITAFLTSKTEQILLNGN